MPENAWATTAIEAILPMLKAPLTPPSPLRSSVLSARNHSGRSSSLANTTCPSSAVPAQAGGGITVTIVAAVSLLPPPTPKRFKLPVRTSVFTVSGSLQLADALAVALGVTVALQPGMVPFAPLSTGGMYTLSTMPSMPSITPPPSRSSR